MGKRVADKTRRNFWLPFAAAVLPFAIAVALFYRGTIAPGFEFIVYFFWAVCFGVLAAGCCVWGLMTIALHFWTLRAVGLALVTAGATCCCIGALYGFYDPLEIAGLCLCTLGIGCGAWILIKKFWASVKLD